MRTAAPPRNLATPAEEEAGRQEEGQRVACAHGLGLKGEGAAVPRLSCLTRCPKDRLSPALWLTEILYT